MCEFPSPMALYDGSCVSISSPTVIPLNHTTDPCSPTLQLMPAPTRSDLKARKSLFSQLKRSSSSCSLFSLFKRSPSPSPPSYEEARIQSTWAKIGVDVTDKRNGPMPHCTPQELNEAIDDLFGVRMAKRVKAAGWA